MRRTASLRSSPGGLRLSHVLLASAIIFTDTVFYAAIVPLLPSYAADFAEAWLLVALVLVAAPCIGLLWSPSMAMVSDGAEARGVDQGYAVALLNLAWASGQTAGAAGGARLGQAYGDALPYLGLACLCALTLLALSRPRYSVALAGE